MCEVVHAALKPAADGIPVFPCKPDKTPYTEHGFKDATTDTRQIKAWWGQYPDALIGMPTGAVSGLIVIDVDVKRGVDGNVSLAALEVEYGKLPDTVEVVTPSGGRHLYFRCPRQKVRNTAGTLGPGLDVRGDGGYVIVPPSCING